MDGVRRRGGSGGSELTGLLRHPIQLIIGDAVDRLASRIAGDRENHEIAEPLKQILGESPRI